MLRLVINNDEPIEDNISWSADDLIALGYVKNFDEWLEFSDHMCNHAMHYFQEKGIEDAYK